MSSDDDVIREFPSGRRYVDPRPNIEVPDGYVLSPVFYYHALGCVIIRWNSAELDFRYLVGFACAMGSKTVTATRAYIESRSFCEMLSALLRQERRLLIAKPEREPIDRDRAVTLDFRLAGQERDASVILAAFHLTVAPRLRIAGAAIKS